MCGVYVFVYDRGTGPSADEQMETEGGDKHDEMEEEEYPQEEEDDFEEDAGAAYVETSQIGLVLATAPSAPAAASSAVLLMCSPQRAKSPVALSSGVRSRCIGMFLNCYPHAACPDVTVTKCQCTAIRTCCLPRRGCNTLQHTATCTATCPDVHAGTRVFGKFVSRVVSPPPISPLTHLVPSAVSPVSLMPLGSQASESPAAAAGSADAGGSGGGGQTLQAETLVYDDGIAVCDGGTLVYNALEPQLVEGSAAVELAALPQEPDDDLGLVDDFV